MARKKAELTRGERNIKWIETYCRIPEGRYVGQPVRLRRFQKQIILDIYDQPPERRTRRAIISFARKNAKTALSAFLLLLHLCGPEARENSQLYSAAQSRDQAAILFGLAAKIIRMSPRLAQYVTIRDSGKQLFCEPLGTLYRALSAEASTAYGLSPVFTVHDELGQVKGPRSDLYEALETASAAQDEPLSIVISTQAPTDADLLSMLIDDALEENDPHTRIFLYTAPLDLPPFAESTIRLANPAYDEFMNQEEVMRMANDASRMPTRESSYRNLILNQRVEVHNPFVTRAIWKQNGHPVVERFDRDTEVWLGLDLSEINDLTALVMTGKVQGKWHVKPIFWLPEHGIVERSREDRVTYDVWRDEGYLETTPGRSIEYSYIAPVLKQIFVTHNVRGAAFDRYNFRHLRPWLVQAGFNDHELERFIDFGQGYVSMSPALRTVEGMLLNGEVAHGDHPVLTMCASNAVVTKDTTGNRKLDKSKSRGRIDGMIAMVMALSIASADEAELEHTQAFVRL